MTQLEFFSRMRHVNVKWANSPARNTSITYYGYERSLSTHLSVPMDLCRNLFLLEAKTWNIRDNLLRWSWATIVDGTPTIVWGTRGLPTVVSPTSPVAWSPAEQPNLGQEAELQHTYTQLDGPAHTTEHTATGR